MIQQLRIYEIFEDNKAVFHGRFRDHALLGVTWWARGTRPAGNGCAHQCNNPAAEAFSAELVRCDEAIRRLAANGG